MKLLRSLGREPFTLCGGVVLIAVFVHGKPPLWALPIVIASWIAVLLADILWQDRFDRK